MDLQCWPAGCNESRGAPRARIVHQIEGYREDRRTTFSFPATQALFADAVGTSLVHMNRVVQELRSLGLLDFDRGRISLLDEARLRKAADFDALYLHLDHCCEPCGIISTSKTISSQCRTARGPNMPVSNPRRGKRSSPQRRSPGTCSTSKGSQVTVTVRNEDRPLFTMTVRMARKELG
ncbi:MULTISPECIES: helix-turn-helix domain-containing protein [unclassified Bradyrhizobium]|uniref:Crp/Fnr family transcriptional regulator n=1 Tax=unclassified Bradyrhizobium TaxID=2631580 RepID=UPI001FF9DE1C